MLDINIEQAGSNSGPLGQQEVMYAVIDALVIENHRLREINRDVSESAEKRKSFGLRDLVLFNSVRDKSERAIVVRNTGEREAHQRDFNSEKSPSNF